MLSPEFRRSLARGEASRLWKRYGLTEPSQLVLEDLAMAMNVLVLEGPLDSADARLLRRGSRGLIRIKQDITSSGRKRFAVAHELGHWLLHAAVTQLLACTSEDLRSTNYAGSELEVEANWFAAELLMPESLVAPRLRGQCPTPDVIEALALEFNVSLTAAAVRFVELSTDYCALIVCKDGRVKWWRASARFEGGLWIAAGGIASASTLAGRHFAGHVEQVRVAPVGMRDWAERRPEYAEEAMEAFIPLGKTGTSLSLLWLI